MNKKLTQLKAKLKAAQAELAIRTRTNNSASRAYNKVTAHIAELEKRIADMAKISEWVAQLQRSRFIGFVARGTQPTQTSVYAWTHTPALQHFARCPWTCRTFKDWEKAVKSSQEMYDEGYAIPQYDISTVKRTWRYKDKIFTTPYDVPVEKMMWNEHLMEFLKMEKTDERSTR